MTELEKDISADLEDDTSGGDDDPAENDLEDGPSLGSCDPAAAIKPGGPPVAGAIWSRTMPRAGL
ncbi:hypothetical protein [Bradyrhizobium sp. USDA 3650]